MTHSPRASSETATTVTVGSSAGQWALPRNWLVGAIVLVVLALVLAVSPVIDVTAGTTGDNLLSDSQHTFVGGLGWTPQGNTTVDHEREPSVDESGSLLITVDESGPWPDDTGTARTGTSPGQDGIPVEAGTELQGSVRVRGEQAGARARCEIRWYDDIGKGRIIGTAFGEPVAVDEGSWSLLNCTATAPERVATVGLRISIEGTEYGEVYHADDAWLLELGSSERTPTTEPSPPPEPTAEPSPPPEPTAEPSPPLEPTSTRQTSPTAEPSPPPEPKPTAESSPEPEPEPTPDHDGNLLELSQQTFIRELGWTGQGNSTVSLADSPSVDDRGALRIAVDRDGPWPDDSGTARVGTLPGVSGTPVAPGSTLDGEVRLRSAAVRTPARCEIRWYDQSGNITRTDTGGFTTVTADQWSRLTCRAAAPADASTVGLRILLADVDYGEVYFADDAWLTRDDQSDPEPEPEPTPDPTPEPTPTSTPKPPSPGPDSWQDAWNTRDLSTIRSWYRANTGIAAAGLSDSDLRGSGTITTSRDGQVIEDVLVSGAINVLHDRVTIRNAKVVNDGGTIAINVPFASREEVDVLTVENVSLVGTGGAGEYVQALGATYLGVGLRASRVNITGFGGGFRLSHGGNDTVDLSMVENIRTHSGSHNTGTSFRGGTGKSLTRSWIEGSTSSALSLYPDAAPIKDFVAHQNLFDGGTYSVLGGDPKTYGSQTTASFTDNLFTRNHLYGPLSSFNKSRPGRVWSGNAYLDGTPIN